MMMVVTAWGHVEHTPSPHASKQMRKKFIWIHSHPAVEHARVWTVLAVLIIMGTFVIVVQGFVAAEKRP
jgi:hypothetical protein